MIKKIGEKLELIHYLFFFLNSILYKKNLDLILLHFIKKSLFNSGPHRTDPCLIPVSGDHLKI